jgi:pimeloyl-ACP methyl ester carboxylesterase
MEQNMHLFKKITVVISILIFLIQFASAKNSNECDQALKYSCRPLNSLYAVVNGVRLHYVEKGEGPLVILLHGWPETSLEWNETINVLADNGYRVVAPDLRGLGLSEKTISGYDKKTIATDIKSLIHYLGKNQAIIIGHDMGGKSAYVMANLYPQSVAKLILVDCLIPGTENADPLHGGSWHYGFHMAPNFPEMLTQNHEKEYISAQIKALSHQKNAISDQKIEAYVKSYSTPGGMTAGFNYYRTLRQDATLVESFKNKKLLMPVLVITGQYGVGDKLGKVVKLQAPFLNIIIIRDSGHFVPEEVPARFNAEVLKFLKNR